MQLSAVAVQLLLGLSNLLGVQAVPSRGSEAWQIETPWTVDEGVSKFVATSHAVAAQCNGTPDGVVQFPQVIHGAHEIFADGRTVLTFGDVSFRHARSFYGSPVVKCKDLAGAKVITWKVYCYAQYFARFSHFPEVAASANHSNLFAETLNLVAVGCLLAVTIVALILFIGKVSRSLIMSVAFSGLLLTVYFILGATELFDLRMPMLEAHRFADLGVLGGLTWFLYGLLKEEVLRKSHFNAYLACVSVSFLIIAVAPTGDSIQLGTSLAFGPIIAVSAVGALGQLRKFSYTGRTRRQAFTLISLSLFLFGCLNEIFVVTGLAPTYTLSSVSCIFGFIFYTFEVNEHVVHAYGELNFLRRNLQSEVDKKTALLAGALDQVQAQQAELVQSAKLASLGTLSAGIAHEINNSLNFVNGAIRPIEKILANVDLGPHRPKVNLLFKTANEGLSLTFGIIHSLRNYTGLNQAAFRDVGILETVHGVCKLIHSKLSDIDLRLDIAPDLALYGSVVGINQILMNLIDNAVDAMEGRGTISISAVQSSEAVVLTVADSGKGISRAVIDRIFEPFFTTKEVGRGTGLGLHIVHMEMQKHKGKLTVQSEEGHGTTFRLEFPLIDFATRSQAA